MSRHDDTVYLRHMLDHAQTAVELSAGKNRSSLDTEPVLRYALLHLVSVLGEAANRVSVAGRTKYTQIAWREMARIPGLLLDHFDTTCPQAEGAIGPLDCVLKALKVLRDKRVAHAEDADIQGMSKTNLDGVSQLLAYAQTFVNLVGGGLLAFSIKGVADPVDFQPDKSKVWTQIQKTINIVEQSSA